MSSTPATTPAAINTRPGQSTTPLTLNTVAILLRAFGINLSTVPSLTPTSSASPPAPIDTSRPTELPAELDSATVRVIVEALCSCGYDIADEAAPVIASLEAREAEAAAERQHVEELIEEDQAELDARAAETDAAIDAAVGNDPEANTVAAFFDLPPASAVSDDTQTHDDTAAVPGPAAPPSTSVWAGNVNPPAPPSIPGFKCAKCNTFNLLRSARDTWYVVTKGKTVGIFKDWLVVQPLVSGVSGAAYRKFESHDAALGAWLFAQSTPDMVKRLP